LILVAALKPLKAFYKVAGLYRRSTPAMTAMGAARDRFYAEAWREAADAAGCAMADLGDAFYEITDGARTVRVRRNLSPLDNSVSLEVAGNKPVVYRLLQDIGVPVPRHVTIGLEDFPRAAEFLSKAGGSVVVKPAAGTGAGRGVCTGIRTLAQLTQATAWAGSFSRRVVVEEQIAGVNYRLLYLDGTLIDCVRRNPPTVEGDGRSTIRTLIDQENRLRLEQGDRRAQVPISIDHDLHRTLAEQGLTLRSNVEPGRRIVLKRVINDNRCDENEAALDRVEPWLADLGRRVAAAVGLRLAGVDIIMPESGPESAPESRTGGSVPGSAVVIDVNATPGFYYHYRRKGAPVRVAIPILSRALEYASKEATIPIPEAFQSHKAGNLG
jgi:cyanophycin synthetase